MGGWEVVKRGRVWQYNSSQVIKSQPAVQRSTSCGNRSHCNLCKDCHNPTFVPWPFAHCFGLLIEPLKINQSHQRACEREAKSLSDPKHITLCVGLSNKSDCRFNIVSRAIVCAYSSTDEAEPIKNKDDILAFIQKQYIRQTKKKMG